MIHANRQRVALLLVMIVGIGLVALPSRPWATAKLIYNPSSSAPLGWYLAKVTTDINRGEFAVVRLPAPIAALADERKYLPKAVPLLKSVAAVAGDLVCEQQGVVRINDAVVARSLQRDGAGRELVAWIRMSETPRRRFVPSWHDKRFIVRQPILWSPVCLIGHRQGDSPVDLVTKLA